MMSSRLMSRLLRCRRRRQLLGDDAAERAEGVPAVGGGQMMPELLQRDALPGVVLLRGGTRSSVSSRMACLLVSHPVASGTKWPGRAVPAGSLCGDHRPGGKPSLLAECVRGFW